MNPLRLLAGKPRESTRTAARETLNITLDNGETVDVLRVRDPRARRIKLSVSERGARLTLPLRASEVAGERFVLEHGEWLVAQLARNGDAALALAPHVTSAIPLRGGELPIAWHEGRALRLVRGGDGLQVTVPPGVRSTSLRRALRDFYEAEARTDLGRWLPPLLPTLPRAPSRIVLKVMSSQWGSLAPNGVVALDLALVLARPSAFEYVFVHELCHLIRADHSRAFWREVEARFPHWRDEREYFHAHGRQLKASLRALLG
ncbi:M48 family metallopeptidase [Lysobacter solisilvae (ex Woo and Kim 2020)]|uniref:M48 family metallopeptidase n=1 Tax=Agrilutibacter terrestris TaxID=2865112 RepID=A0A7H0FTU3_9GAMM|nr:SprT family zinc-dependent metalloprotease [Lysobacter terrestris]QNP39459.1 M48 family metallopeptidase [Lysobacter terrestris]